VPYIKQHQREKINVEIRRLGEAAREMPGFSEQKGAILNYIICSLAVEFIDRKSYIEMSLVRSAMIDAADEFYRRLMAPYEDEKIKGNGDIPGFPKQKTGGLADLFTVKENGEVINDEGEVVGKINTPLPFLLKD
jgi:hypothetical protein